MASAMRRQNQARILVFMVCASAVAYAEISHLCTVKDRNGVDWGYWGDSEAAFFHDAVEDKSVYTPPEGVGEYVSPNDLLICQSPVVKGFLGINVYLSYTDEASYAYMVPVHNVEGKETLGDYRYYEYADALHGLCEASDLPFCLSTQYDALSTSNEVMSWISSHAKAAQSRLFFKRMRRFINSGRSKRELVTRDDSAVIKPTVRNERKRYYDDTDIERIKFNYKESGSPNFLPSLIEALLSDPSSGYPGDLASLSVGGHLVPGANIGALSPGYGTLSFFVRGSCDKDGSSKIYGLSNSHVLNENDDAVDMLMRKGSPVYAPSFTLAPVVWARQKGHAEFERLRQIITEYLVKEDFPLFRDSEHPSIADLPKFVRSWLSVNDDIIEDMFDRNHEVAEILQRLRDGQEKIVSSLPSKTFASEGYRSGTHVGSFSSGKAFDFRRTDARTGSDVDIGVFEFDDALDRVPSNMVSLDESGWTTVTGALKVEDLEGMANSGELSDVEFYFVGSRSGRTTCKILDLFHFEEGVKQFEEFAAFPYVAKTKKGGQVKIVEQISTMQPSVSSNVLFDGVGGKGQIICYMDPEFGSSGEPWPRKIRDLFVEMVEKEDLPDDYSKRMESYMKSYIKYMLHSWDSPGREGDSGGILYSRDGKIVGVGHLVSWNVQGFLSGEGGRYMNMLAVSPIESVLSSVRTVLAENSQRCKDKDDWTVSMDLRE